MRLALELIAFGLALIVIGYALTAHGHGEGYRFADVILERAYDGDTITVTLPGIHPLWGDNASVRINRIDTPEIRGKCLAESTAAIEARNRLVEILEHADRVDLVDCGREKYGRLLCSVEADKRDVGDILIGEGLAREYEGGKRAGWCK